MSECDVVVLDGDEEEYDAGDEDIDKEDVDKEDEELDKFILDDWDFVLYFISFVVYSTCLSLYNCSITFELDYVRPIVEMFEHFGICSEILSEQFKIVILALYWPCFYISVFDWQHVWNLQVDGYQAGSLTVAVLLQVSNIICTCM